MVSTPPNSQSPDRNSGFLQQSPLFSQLLKPRPDLLAEVAAAQAGGGSGNGSVEAAQRIAALLAAAAAAAQNSNHPDSGKRNHNGDMKVPPNLSMPSGFPLTHDLLWRYPNPFLPQPPPSPLESQLKSQLPGGLGHDPRCWNREDVNIFLRYCEREFDLEQIDMEKFVMNGKALCLLSKSDFSERCAGGGDVIHNILQMLQRETYGLPPSSPRHPALMTPTSPHTMPLSPHAWPLLSPHAHAAAAGETFPNLSHLISQANSVTLSPAPSLESQNGTSPKVSVSQAQADLISSIHQLYPPPTTSANSLNVPPPLNNILNRRSQSASSSHSDSEDSSDQQHLNKSPNSKGPRSPKDSMPTPTSSVKEPETPELNTNGRLLWDFLQQLLNDSQQRYTSYIAWKNKETGVFKIVDPAGLAKLWGIQKNHLSMNYDKMSRALRYYYRVNILRKVQGERHCYQFLRNPSELKSIKNISLLRQQMEAQAAAQKLAAQHVAQAALRGMHPPPAASNEPCRPQHQHGPVSGSMEMEIKEELGHEEPTDLTLNAEDKAALRMRRERMEREHCRLSGMVSVSGNGHQDVAGSNHRDREQLEPRHHPQAPQFDFRHLLPQVSIKSE